MSHLDGGADERVGGKGAVEPEVTGLGAAVGGEGAGEPQVSELEAADPNCRTWGGAPH